MAITYDLTLSGTSLLISKVRLELGDTVNGIGVRPDGSNLSDAEITMWLTEEGSNVMRAVARACYSLARMWSIVMSTSSPSYSEQAGKVAAEWQARGDGIVKTYGGISGSGGMSSSAVKRVDGYSVNNPQPSTTEYTGDGPIYIIP